MEHQQFLVLYSGKFEWYLIAIIYKQGIGNFYRQMRMQHGTCQILNISVNRASMVIGPVRQEIRMELGYSNI